jgi:hypothetical protein
VAFIVEKPPWRIIDHQRDAILVRVPAGPDGPVKFNFSWKGLAISFEAIYTSTKDSNKQEDVTWRIISLYLPKAFSKKKEKELRDLITEALNTFGTTGSRKTFQKSITVSFPSQSSRRK